MSYRVLITDDQRSVSRLLRSALETLEPGLIVSEAKSGEEALLEAYGVKVDLLIADFRLPGINGLELKKKFLAIHPAAKVIIISGITDPIQLQKIWDARPDAFFPKPVPMAEFLEAVETCLGLARTIVHPVVDAPVAAQPAPKKLALADILIALRTSVDAASALLINDLGLVTAKAGQDLGFDNQDALFADLLALLGASHKMAFNFDHSESNFHLFVGSHYDTIFLPVGSRHALAILGPGLCDFRQLSEKLNLIRQAADEFIEVLKNINAARAEIIPEKPPEKIPVEVTVRPLEDMPEDFLSFLTQVGRPVQDVDSFWDAAVREKVDSSDPDKLTFEQASKLGLAPGSSQ